MKVQHHTTVLSKFYHACRALFISPVVGDVITHFSFDERWQSHKIIGILNFLRSFPLDVSSGKNVSMYLAMVTIEESAI